MKRASSAGASTTSARACRRRIRSDRTRRSTTVPTPSTWPVIEMPAQAIGEPQRLLEIHVARSRRGPSCSAASRPRRRSRAASRRDLDHRQAAAVHRDAVAHRDVRRRRACPAIDDETEAVAARRASRVDASHRLHDAGEHQRVLARLSARPAVSGADPSPMRSIACHASGTRAASDESGGAQLEHAARRIAEQRSARHRAGARRPARPASNAPLSAAPAST